MGDPIEPAALPRALTPVPEQSFLRRFAAGSDDLLPHLSAGELLPWASRPGSPAPALDETRENAPQNGNRSEDELLPSTSRRSLPVLARKAWRGLGAMFPPGRRTPVPVTKALWHWYYSMLPPSDLPAWKRVLTALPRLPKDFILERASWPGQTIDLIFYPVALLFGMPLAMVIAVDWVIGEVPWGVNVARSLAHRSPKAKPGEWWKRDWTYFNRPGARQDRVVAVGPEAPLETRPDAKGIPKWMRSLTKQAALRGQFSPPGLLDDWLNQRSRWLTWTVEHALVGLGYLGGIPVAPLLLADNWILGNIQDAVAGWVGLRNHDIRRLTRSEIFQRPGDVIVHAPGGATRPHVEISKRTVGLPVRARPAAALPSARRTMSSGGMEL